MSHIRRKRHTIPGLNTTSTADISFMLLIFFLVTTSMDVNKGMTRRMPPADDKVEQLQDIDKDNVLTIRLMADGEVTVNENAVKDDATFRKGLRHFIIERGKQHILELQIDREAKYDKYFHLQNQIVLAYSEIRNAAAEKKYKTAFNKLPEEQREVITKLYPQRMTEKYD